MSEEPDEQFARAFDVLRRAIAIKSSETFLAGLREWLDRQRRDMDRVLIDLDTPRRQTRGE